MKKYWKWALPLLGAVSLNAMAALQEPENGQDTEQQANNCQCSERLPADPLDPAAKARFYTHPCSCDATTALRPQAKDFPSYSRYLQALFAWQRTHQASEVPEPAAVQSPSGETVAPQSLEDAIAQAAQGDRPVYVDESGKPRTTFKSFGLDQVAAQDLSSSGVDGVLGIFGKHIAQSGSGPRISGNGEDVTFNLFPDTNLSGVFAEDVLLNAPLLAQLDIFNTTVFLEDGWAYANGTLTLNPDGSMTVKLNSEAEILAIMVDRDGFPNFNPAYSGAGAFIIDPLRIKIAGINANIRASSKPYPDVSTLTTTVFATEGIDVNLSGTRIGVADASKGAPDFDRITRKDLGDPYYFLYFGQGSKLEIGAGLTQQTVLQRPDGSRRPLVTGSANIPSLILNDVSLVDHANGGRLNIASFSITNLVLRDLKVYVIGDKIELEQEAKNFNVAIKDISAGDSNAKPVGDFYIDNVTMRSKVTFEAH